mmetsp:Transcript_28341/g.58031  ORF Transcript_28341/g.58031 Transcript_28341/m.58031 type:complete len:216 (+) Transcript_28341:74-721(+)
MNPSTSTNGRHSDATKSAFLRQAAGHEATKTSVRKLLGPTTKPFVFKQTYTLSSGGVASTDESSTLQRVQQTRLAEVANPGSNVSRLSPAFSSFKFQSSPESISSAAYGQGLGLAGQPQYLPLRKQKVWGGASMAGLAMKADQQQDQDVTRRIQNALPKAQRLTASAALALPACSMNDPQGQTLLESKITLESRRSHLAARLAEVEVALGSGTPV